MGEFGGDVVRGGDPGPVIGARRAWAMRRDLVPFLSSCSAEEVAVMLQAVLEEAWSRGLEIDDALRIVGRLRQLAASRRSRAAAPIHGDDCEHGGEPAPRSTDASPSASPLL